MSAEVIDDGLEANIRAVAQNIDTLIVNAITNWLRTFVVPKAKLDAPIKTGKLRGEMRLVQVVIQGETKLFVVGWGPDAPYGRFQERGWLGVKPKKFTENAIRDEFGQLSPIWIAEVSQYVAQLQGAIGAAATIKV